MLTTNTPLLLITLFSMRYVAHTWLTAVGDAFRALWPPTTCTHTATNNLHTQPPTTYTQPPTT